MPDPPPGRGTAPPTQFTSSGQIDSRSINLQRAAAVLETTHNRIRNRLSELDLTLAPPPPNQADAIGPSHSAIVLSNTRGPGMSPEIDARLDRLRSSLPPTTRGPGTSPETDERLDRLRSSLPPTAMERLELYEASIRRQETPRNGSGGVGFVSAVQNNPSPSHSNIERPSTSRPHGASRPWLEHIPGRRRDESNDPSTFLGRRVAAREAHPHLHEADPPLNDSGQEILIGLLNARAVLNPSAQSASSLTPEDPPFLQAESAGQRIPSHRNNALVHIAPALTPISSVSVRVTTHAPEVDPDGLPEHAVEANANENQSWTYVGNRELRRGNETTRTTDINGVEPVHGMGDSGFLVQTLTRSGVLELGTPRRPRTPPGFVRVEDGLRGLGNQPFSPQDASGSTNAATQTSTRRGWMHLDADGDEIWTEDEGEDIRAESRIRARSVVDLVPLGLRPHRRQNLVSVTQPVFPGSDGGNAARVHLNSSQTVPTRAHQRVFPVDSSSLSAIGSDLPQLDDSHPNSPTSPFYVDPLPVPIASMAPPAQKYQKGPSRIIRIEHRTNLAGR